MESEIISNLPKDFPESYKRDVLAILNFSKTYLGNDILKTTMICDLIGKSFRGIIINETIKE